MSAHLAWVQAGRYGAFADRKVGPFEPGLNVVFGPNEAGKSTTVHLVHDVLFGWEDARGAKNTHEPSEGERAGSLIFVDEGREETLARVGARPLEGAVDLVGDLDEPTFEAMFSLTVDELASLRRAPDVTARLISAGTGTATSPTEAFVEIEQRIAAHTAPVGTGDESVVALSRQLEEKRVEVNEATEAVESMKAKAREWRELRASRNEATSRIEGLNADIEELTALQAETSTVRERMDSCEHDLAELRSEREAMLSTFESDDALDELLSLTASEEQAIEAQLDEFAAAQKKSQRMLETAKENSASSTASYEALLEMNDEPSSRLHTIRTKTSHAIVSIVPTLAFIMAGIPLFVHGRSISSLSFTVFGIGLIVLAFILGIAAVVALLRPRKEEDALDYRRKDAQWVMLQDKKRLDSCATDLDDLQYRIDEFLEGNGLGRAQGSIRQARALLEEARRIRTANASASQRVAALDLRIQTREDELERLQRRIEQITEGLGFAPGDLGRSIDDLLRQRVAQRSALLEVSEDASLRFGELSKELEAARHDHRLDSLKMEYQRILANLRRRKHELIELLLAKRLIECSIAAWEGNNQPEVYEEASRLFALITHGRWVRVSVSAEGSILAEDAAGVTYELHHLSLGTCQQLYLALRVALLLTASKAGSAIPVLCDDILVNFDAERREGAAIVIAELAAARQVIFFTCHGETVDALRAADPTLNFLSLA